MPPTVGRPVVPPLGIRGVNAKSTETRNGDAPSCSPPEGACPEWEERCLASVTSWFVASLFYGRRLAPTGLAETSSDGIFD